MRATATVIGGSLIKSAVVVVKNQMLAFVADDVCDAPEIPVVLGDDKGAGVIGQHHSGGVDKAALVVAATGVLARADRHIRRIVAARIFRPVSPRDEDSVGRMSEARSIAVAAGDVE